MVNRHSPPGAFSGQANSVLTRSVLAREPTAFFNHRASTALHEAVTTTAAPSGASVTLNPHDWAKSRV